MVIIRYYLLLKSNTRVGITRWKCNPLGIVQEIKFSYADKGICTNQNLSKKMKA